MKKLILLGALLTAAFSAGCAIDANDEVAGDTQDELRAKKASEGQPCGGGGWGPHGRPLPAVSCKAGLECVQRENPPMDAPGGVCKAKVTKASEGQSCGGGGWGPGGRPMPARACDEGLECVQRENPPMDAPGGICQPKARKATKGESCGGGGWGPGGRPMPARECDEGLECVQRENPPMDAPGGICR